MEEYQSKYTGLQIEEAIGAGLEIIDAPQQALARLGGRPNRNIARNPDFRINQRGFSSSDWRSGYGPDGWQSAGYGSLEYSGGAVKTNNQYLLQFYEPGEVETGVYTISALCSDNIEGDFGFWTGKSTHYASNNYENGFASATIEITKDMVDSAKNPFIYIRCKNNGSISHIKVEKSPVQTLAYKGHDGQWITFEPLDIALELLRCFRYYYDSGANSTGESGFEKPEVWSVSSSSMHYASGPRFPVRMRTPPAISFYSGTKRTLGKVAYGSDGADALATPHASAIGTDGFGQINLNGEDPSLTGNQIQYYYIANADF